MTSELRVDNLKGSTTGGSINVLGEGTSATTNLQQGLLKGWMSFDGESTVATRDSFNTTSLTDNGTGDYSMTISNPFSNNFYASVCDNESGSGDVARQYGHADATGANGRYEADLFRVFCFQTNTIGTTDVAFCSVMLAGDLA